ncbi:UNVERIFIED_ORG: hypothetical protein DFO82_1220 [Idiomarina abyssalis]|uniref:hypothetical protein n=1 Tax=Idiomarina sp. 017G TaxID=2183988 RepID=UPI000E0E35D1|nr:hypothetical protein [Idiomarina sp. 017G]TDO51980.1 hypothetical protein DEU30_102183 [Idiomarina sp. 017G]
MSKTIFFFVKVFSEKSHAEEFLKGSLYSNRLVFFRKLEDTAQANRGDKHEAVVGWYQPNQITLTLNGRELKDLAAPVSLQMNQHNNLNVFCIYAAHSGSFEKITVENIFDFRDHLKIPPNCLALGKHAVVVTQAKSFIDRVVSAVKDKNYGLKAGLVEYYDPSLFSGSFSEDEAVFRKRSEFEHQREYRFSFDTGGSVQNSVSFR